MEMPLPPDCGTRRAVPPAGGRRFRTSGMPGAMHGKRHTFLAITQLARPGMLVGMDVTAVTAK
jgi:hypothetical protein